jgi:hypothetical protein
VTRGLRACLAAALLGGCEPSEVREWKCVGPLVELVRWRDGEERARLFGGKIVTPEALGREEQERVDAAVEALRDRRGACEMTWSVLMHQPPDNPGLRLREEAILRMLELPPRDYPPVAVGFAGRTTAGRPPVGDGAAR